MRIPLQNNQSISWLTHICTLLAAAFLFVSPAKATHLVGGSVTYEYKGEANGKHEYLITVAVYRDCSIPPTQPSPTPFDAQIMLGIYEDRGSKPFLNGESWVYVALKSEKVIDPLDGGSPCSKDPQNICFREGIYQYTAYLPTSTYGYHIEYIRCCRNKLINVPENEGQTFYGYIPPTSTAPNTSPAFTDVPVPYICIKDTVNLLNSATEPDGDSLVFSLAWPYAGGDKDFPMPEPPKSFINPPLVKYNADHSYLKPFGKDGYASIDPLTGATKVYATVVGKYVIAIDVREYRDGKLINTTRRDIQILVNKCDPNPAPYRTSAGGSTATTFYVTGGEKLEIPLKYEDDNFITLIASGELVDNSNSSISPKGSFTSTSANKTLNTTFSWPTKCQYVRSKPYVLNVRVRDNGCPSKFVNHTYTIYVLPFKGTDNISGPSPACQGWPEIYSATKTETGSSLVWRAVGGTIVSQNNSTASIIWDDVPEGIVKVVEISKYGCPGDTVERRISIRPKPPISPITGNKIPCTKVVSRYEVNTMPGSSYIWVVDGGTKQNSGSNGKLDVLWGEGDSGKVKVVHRSSDGCFSDTAYFKVDIRAPIIDQIYGSLSVCPNARGVDYWVVGREGSTFFWSIAGGIQAGGGNTDRIKVDWGEKGGGIVRAVEITAEGCVSDTIELLVDKDYVLITTPIHGDTSVCEYTDGEKYSVHFTNGSTYEWKIIGGTIVKGAGTAEITVNWDKQGTGFLTVTETAHDAVNDKPCIGKPVTLRISIYPLPSTKGIFGPAEICELDTATFTVTGLDGSIYFWTIDNDTLFKAANYNDTFTIVASKTDFPTQVGGNHIIRVREMTKDSCFGEVLSFTLKIHSQPITSNIKGPSVICQPNLTGHTYSVTGFGTSVFEWDIAGGVITSGVGTSQITVDWLQAGIGELSVTEKSSFGCSGETKRLTVKVDSLYLTIDRVTTGRQNEKVVEIYWNAKNKQFMNGSIKIYRMREGQGQFTLLDSIHPESGFYTDVNVATDQYTYSYYIEAINACGDKVQSDRHRSILLKAKMQNDTTGTIYWTRYQGWPNGVDYHYIFRRLNDDSTLVFYDLNKLDSFLTVYRGLDGWNQCYRVEAVKAQDNTLVSWSNSVCFEFEPILWIPNAFTPGNLDEFNDQFRVFLYNYKTFNITIYNRWGERIFESDDLNKLWDGTWKGANCPQDVYIYTVNVSGYKTKIYRSGTIHLMR